MITVTANDFNEAVHSQDEEIVFNGPPSFLTGKITLTNRGNDIMHVKDVPLRDDNAVLQKHRLARGYGTVADTLPINVILMPGEEFTHSTSFELHPQTPPGVYESRVVIGGLEKRLKIVVQENIGLTISPSSIYFLGVEPGKTYRKELLMINNGNVDVTVPDSRHNTLLDFDYLCRIFSLAIREHGAEGFQPTMDALTRSIHKEMADWVTVKIDESNTVVAAGRSVALHLSLTLPQNANPNRDYFGNIRLWNRVITYQMKSERHQSYQSS